MKNLLLLFLSAILFVSIESENDSRKESIDIIHVNDRVFLSILDSIINHEKQCVYYSPDLIFSIHNRKVKDTIIEYQIGAYGLALIDFTNNNYKGCFEYDGHWFVVEGLILDEQVFVKTDKKKEFVFYKPYGVFENGSNYSRVFEDDIYSFWIYQYIDHLFIFKEMVDYYCNCKEF